MIPSINSGVYVLPAPIIASFKFAMKNLRRWIFFKKFYQNYAPYAIKTTFDKYENIFESMLDKYIRYVYCRNKQTGSTLQCTHYFGYGDKR
jgi:hypothetical protein